jgi:hypothetical protein
LDINKLTQRIDGIRIECKDLSANCSVESSIGPHFLIPNINRAIADPIQFFRDNGWRAVLKFTLTETTGIINTGWLKNAFCMGELYS